MLLLSAAPVGCCKQPQTIPAWPWPAQPSIGRPLFSCSRTDTGPAVTQAGSSNRLHRPASTNTQATVAVDASYCISHHPPSCFPGEHQAQHTPLACHISDRKDHRLRSRTLTKDPSFVDTNIKVFDQDCLLTNDNEGYISAVVLARVKYLKRAFTILVILIFEEEHCKTGTFSTPLLLH